MSWTRPTKILTDVRPNNSCEECKGRIRTGEVVKANIIDGERRKERELTPLLCRECRKSNSEISLGSDGVTVKAVFWDGRLIAVGKVFNGPVCLNSQGDSMEGTNYESAKKALSSNPSEGQVEQSVVIPILKEIGYNEKDILNKVSVRVKSGSKDYEQLEADIIATDPDGELPTLVVEAKSPDSGLELPDDLSQGRSYCNSPDVNARYLFLTSGYSNRLYDSTELAFEYDLEQVFDSPDYFRECLLGNVDYEEDAPTKTDIKKFFEYGHNRMYAEDAIKPAEALHILTKLILIKTNEERGKSLYNLRGVLDYKDEYENTDTEREKREIEDEIYSYLSACLDRVDTDLLYPEERNISRNLSVTTLFEIVDELYNYTLDYIPAEKKGSAFDSFLNTTLKGREMGQFFTHRNIVNFIVEMADPKLSDRIIDPACGTGGFIETSFLRLNEQLRDVYPESSEEYQEKLDQLRTNQIFGIEKDGNVASLAKLSMSMNGDGHSTIYKANGLTFSNNKIDEGRFDAVLTNPPFGSNSDVQVKDKEVLSEFDMGKKYKMGDDGEEYSQTGSLQDGQDIGVLFLERCIDLLKPGGTLGIILHDGVFANSTTGYVRQYIREHCNLKAVVKLSEDTFDPYSDGSGAQASVLLCEKREKGVEYDDECFFAIAEKVGYEYKKSNLVDAENHLSDVLDSYNEEGDYKNARWKDVSDLPNHRRLDPQYHCRELNLGSTEFKELKEVIEGDKLLAGYAYSSDYFGQGDRPLVKGRHLNNSLLHKDDLETIPEDYYQENKKIELEEGDILLAMDGGSNGFDASYIDNQVTDIAVNQRISVIRVDESEMPPSYVFFVIISELGQKQLMKSKTQTATVAHLSNSQIEELKIPLLDEDTIQEIANNFENYVSSVRETEEIFEELSETVTPVE